MEGMGGEGGEGGHGGMEPSFPGETTDDGESRDEGPQAPF
jgi:hypothetical protein